jgi:large subunit ribosomal protein L35
MPKIKSHSGAKKRFKKTSGGKWLHRKSGLRHLLTGMTGPQGRKQRQAKVEEKTSSKARLLEDYLPYK